MGLAMYQATAIGVIEKDIYNKVDQEMDKVKKGNDVEGMSGYIKDLYKKKESAKEIFNPIISERFNRMLFGVGALGLGVAATTMLFPLLPLKIMEFFPKLLTTFADSEFFRSIGQDLLNMIQERYPAYLNKIDPLGVKYILMSGWVAASLILAGIVIQWEFVSKTIKDFFVNKEWKLKDAGRGEKLWRNMPATEVPPEWREADSGGGNNAKP